MSQLAFIKSHAIGMVTPSPNATFPYTEDIAFRCDLRHLFTAVCEEYIEDLERSGSLYCCAVAEQEKTELAKRPFGVKQEADVKKWWDELKMWYTKVYPDAVSPDTRPILERLGTVVPLSDEGAVNAMQNFGGGGPFANETKEVYKAGVPILDWPFGYSKLQTRLQYGGKHRVINGLNADAALSQTRLSMPLNQALLKSGYSYNGPAVEAFRNMKQKWRRADARFAVKLDAKQFGPRLPLITLYNSVKYLMNKYPTEINALHTYLNTLPVISYDNVAYILECPYSGTVTGQPFNNTIGTVHGLYPGFVVTQKYGGDCIGSVDDQLLMVNRDPMDYANMVEQLGQKYGMLFEAKEAVVNEHCLFLAKRLWDMNSEHVTPLAVRFIGRIMVAEQTETRSYWAVPTHVVAKTVEWNDLQFKLWLQVMTIVLDQIMVPKPGLGLGLDDTAETLLLRGLKAVMSMHGSAWLRSNKDIVPGSTIVRAFNRSWKRYTDAFRYL